MGDNMNQRQRQKEALIAYFRSGEKQKGNERIGVELEHFIVNEDGTTVNYFDEPGVETLLNAVSALGYPTKRENGHPLQVDLPGGAITMEPGSQFEFSLKNYSCVAGIEAAYRDMWEVVEPLLPRHQNLVNLGYHPVTKIDEIRILPKERYGHMFEYFKQRGTMAHNMMKGTAALQLSFDYTSEADFTRKFQLLTRLTPVFYALFDNVAIFEGEPAPHRGMRMEIWENTDKDRSGLVPGSVAEGFGYDAYAEYILDTPMIFRDTDKGTEYVGKNTFAELYDPDRDGEEFLYHALSIVFPDVRLKHYIEFRVADSVPIALSLACAALLKAVLYDEATLEALIQQTQSIGDEELERIRNTVRTDGYNTPFLRGTIAEFADELLVKAAAALDEKERDYLAPLSELVGLRAAPRDAFSAVWHTQGLAEAIHTFATERSGDVQS